MNVVSDSSIHTPNYCSHRLPCGVCMLMLMQCPMQPLTVTPTWKYEITTDITGPKSDSYRPPPNETVYSRGTDTAGNCCWTGVYTGEHKEN